MTQRSSLETALHNAIEESQATESRYHRQETLLRNEGWDQSRLEQCKVAVIGNDALANYAALTLASFGFGHIEMYGQGMLDEEIRQNHSRDGDADFSKGFLLFKNRRIDTKARAIEDVIHEINPEIYFRGINIGMAQPANCTLLQKPDIIIDATNDPASKLCMIDYALVNNIPVVSMSASIDKGSVGVIRPGQDTHEQRQLIENLMFPEYVGKSQDPVVSQVIGGIAIEEARKIINPMNNERVIEDIIIYNQRSNSRFDHSVDKEPSHEGVDLKEYNICLVGAGALGNFVGLGLALQNIGRLVVVDFDDVEVTNLNRQVLLYGSVGAYKAEALVEKLRWINPRGNYRAKIDKITPESDRFFARNKFDMIIDTVDNNKARALINHFSLKYDIPFISGGTRYNSGQVNICIPGESACLDCQADIDNLALGNYRAQSCILAAQPSVITSNQITGGLMVGEVAPVLDRRNFGDFAHGEIKYVANEDHRLALLPAARNSCDCHKDKERLQGWNDKMQGVYES